MNNKNHKYSMSDMIATMAINGATKDELDRIIKYSAAVIDAERARKELGIDELEKKYMTVDSHKSRCRDCACLVEGNDGSWCCDELEKDIHNIQDEDCPETSDSPKAVEKAAQNAAGKMDKDFDIYPLTITEDRYTGVYSGGEWTAWHCDADDVPPEIASDDVTCCDFWGMAHYSKVSRLGYVNFMFNGDDFQCPVFGVGGTIEAAVADLKRRLEDA